MAATFSMAVVPPAGQCHALPLLKNCNLAAKTPRSQSDRAFVAPAETSPIHEGLNVDNPWF